MREKLIIIAIIGILLLTSSLSLLATGKNVKTERRSIQITDDISSLSNGNTFYVGGNGPDNYSAIQDAIDSASPGDTVYVYDDSSPYYENIIVDKTLNLIGENKNTTILDGFMSGNAAIYISAEKVNISGFLIRNSHPVGIEIKSKYTNISDNNIFQNIVSGIICYSNENMIFGNNIFSNLIYGIFFAEGSSYNIVLNNNISFNHEGIESAGSHNTISDNIITFNEGRAISLIYGDNTISGNLFSNNVLGIWFDSSNNLVYNNNFLNNEEGVFIRSSENNMFYHNNFIGNTDGNAEEFYCINTIWDDGYSSGGNYWDDYTGQDNDGDGIGDTPYYIPDEDGQRNSDRYPLMKARGKEDNKPPAIPEISGSTSGKIKQEYTYTTITTDPEGDKVRYCFDWGDGTKTWADYSESGETVNINHIWTRQGNYEIKVKARDIYGYESPWSDPLPVEMPRNRAINTPLFKFLEHHPILFQLLQRFLKL